MICPSWKRSKMPAEDGHFWHHDHLEEPVGNYQLPRPSTQRYASPEDQERATRISRLLVLYAKQAVTAIPVVGPLVSGGLEVIQRLSDDADQRQLEGRLQQLVSSHGQLTHDLQYLQDDLKVLTALAVLSYSQQAELLAWLQANEESVA